MPVTQITDMLDRLYNRLWQMYKKIEVLALQELTDESDVTLLDEDGRPLEEDIT